MFVIWWYISITSFPIDCTSIMTYAVRCKPDTGIHFFHPLGPKKSEDLIKTTFAAKTEDENCGEEFLSVCLSLSNRRKFPAIRFSPLLVLVED
jgi:hypothetical protein